ncbi:DNA polymerase epsilon subunit C [Aspergillus flavus]|nr:DNA polymerase epsilon subunit C [Aspergillus flavus]RAQ68096.1 DNA polymerase epsilon subunit C [Aspergillus flavus]
MDFWSRLIGGSRSLSTKTYRASSPTERLTAFKRTCNTLQQIWRSTNSPSGDQSATTHARNCIDRLNSVLSDESRGPAPHPCLAYAASSQIFVTVTKLALSSYDDGMLRSATVFFNTLIDSEVDGVVDNRLFARALVDLVRRADKHSEDVEGRLVELLFGVANNIRLQPDILPAWFAPRSEDQDREQQTNTGTEFAGATRKDDFPLFYLLVEYVHHGGRAGDFARTGLLYLIETASRSKNLERWLIESDLATLMATGLGALYSQLGSLSFDATSDEKMPHIVALSDHAKQETALPPALGATVDSFMSYLLFWQDTIDHCKSAEVNGTLLDHFQVLFLEQLLYPSLLESSDVEGGSTAAVLTYLYRILESINQDDLVHRILHFLLASPSDMETSPTLKVNMSVSRRKSLDVLAAFSEEAAKPSPSLFNLRDLALLGLQSANRQTVLATLRLMAVILQRHHTFARSLIRTVPGQYAGQRTVGQLNAELEQLTEMATSIVEDPTLNDSFEDYLKDASLILESHLYIPPAETGLEDDRPLEIRQEDPIVQELLNCVETFFTNSVIVNLALTEVLMSIASSHLISLDSWLLVDPSKYVYDDQTTAQDGPMEILDQIKLAYQEPSLSSSETPTLTSALQKLVQKIQQWRKDVPDFDILVAARRDLLHHDDPAKDTGRLQQPFEASTRLPSERRPLKMPLDSDIGSPRGRSSLVQDLPGTPASRQAAVGSPLRGSSLRSPDSRESSSPRMTAAEELRKRLSKPFQVDHPHKATMAGEEPEPAADAIVEEEAESAIADEEPRSATLGHVLTNVVILYEFLLEVSATVQARSTLFGEAGYPGVGWSAPLDEELM